MFKRTFSVDKCSLLEHHPTQICIGKQTKVIAMRHLKNPVIYLLCTFIFSTVSKATYVREGLDFSQKTRLVLGGIGHNASYEAGPYGYSISPISEIHVDTDLTINITRAADPDIQGDAWNYAKLLCKVPELTRVKYGAIWWNYVGEGFVGGLFTKREMKEQDFSQTRALTERMINSLKPMIDQLEPEGKFIYNSLEGDYFSREVSFCGIAEDCGFSFLVNKSLFPKPEGDNYSEYSFRSVTSESAAKAGYGTKVLSTELLTRYNRHYFLETDEIRGADTYGVLQSIKEALQACGLKEIKMEVIVRNFCPNVGTIHDVFSLIYDERETLSANPSSDSSDNDGDTFDDEREPLSANPSNDSSDNDGDTFDDNMVYFQFSGVKK